MPELMKFIFNVESIEGTTIQKFIDLHVTKNERPEVYKPRKGKVNGNLDKFSPELLRYMREYAGELITKLGYYDLFRTDGEEGVLDTNPEFVAKFNDESRGKSISDYNESSEVTSIMINFAQLLLRKKSPYYPEGSTSHRFKNALRKKVTVSGKSVFADAMQADENPRAMIGEMSLKETEDEDDKQ